MFRKKARNVIAKAKETLDHLGIPFWLSSGTCLGRSHVMDHSLFTGWGWGGKINTPLIVKPMGTFIAN